MVIHGGATAQVSAVFTVYRQARIRICAHKAKRFTHNAQEFRWLSNFGSKLIEAFSNSIPARRKVKGRDERHRAVNAEPDTPHMLAAGAT